mmetsp:Transcript_14839/g.34363  ORF Transcript_14839/g.34363 Transcript_14839/m.34363 type:complete len:830 (-) Transcript_14839:336-2825(-)
MIDVPITHTRAASIDINHNRNNIMTSSNLLEHHIRRRSASPRVRPWTAADSDKCEYVLEVLVHDVMLGRGSGPNDHAGNIQFRDLVHARKTEYLSTNHRQTKALIAKEIVDQVYQRGGRFLKKLSPIEAARMLPQVLADNGLDEDSENDISPLGDIVDAQTRDIYQVQKHSVVMEKAKQALRQNQRNGSQSPHDSPGAEECSSLTSFMGHSKKKITLDSAPHVIVVGDNNGSSTAEEKNNLGHWTSIAMGNMNIPTRLNACSASSGNNSNSNDIGFSPNQNGGHHIQHQGGTFHGNGIQNDTASDPFQISSGVFSASSQQQQNQDSSHLQGFHQHHHHHQQQVNGGHGLNRLHQQRDLLVQYQQQLNQTQQSQFLLEQSKQAMQELENEIRKEQLRRLQIESMHKVVSSPPLYSKHEEAQHQHHQTQLPLQSEQKQSQQSQQGPPHYVNGFETYTATLDEMEGNRQDATMHCRDDQSLGNAKEVLMKASSAKGDVGNRSSHNGGGKNHDSFSAKDDKSMMQMSTMMGSFKDMSVRSNEDSSMHNSNDTIGTIDNFTGGIVGGFSMAQMSGISIMSMMNDSTESLFRSSGKAKDLGAHNASWGTSEEKKSTISPVVTASLGIGQNLFPNGKSRFGSGAYVPHRRSSTPAAYPYVTGSKNSTDNSHSATAVSAILAMASTEGGGGNEISPLQQHQQQRRSQSFTLGNNPNANSHIVDSSVFNANDPTIDAAAITAAAASISAGNIEDNYRNLSLLMGSWRNGNIGAHNGSNLGTVNGMTFPPFDGTPSTEPGGALGFGNHDGFKNHPISVGRGYNMSTTRDEKHTQLSPNP